MNLRTTLLFFALMCGTEGAKIVRFFHGFGSSCFIESHFKDHFPGLDVKCIETGMGVIGSFEDQIKSGCLELSKEKDILAGGFTLIGISQGGLLARAILQECEVGKFVKRVISIGGPHMGVARVPFTGHWNPLNLLVSLCKISFVEKLIGPCGYVHDEQKLKDFRNALSRLNNYHDENPEYKRRVMALDLFMAIGFDDDQMIQPKNTSLFGFFADEKQDSYVDMEDTRLYKEDLVGIKALSDRKGLFRCSVPGGHLQLGEEGMRKLVVAFADFTNTDYWLNKEYLKKHCKF